MDSIRVFVMDLWPQQSCCANIKHELLVDSFATLYCTYNPIPPSFCLVCVVNPFLTDVMRRSADVAVAVESRINTTEVCVCVCACVCVCVCVYDGDKIANVLVLLV